MKEPKPNVTGQEPEPQRPADQPTDQPGGRPSDEAPPQGPDPYVPGYDPYGQPGYPPPGYPASGYTAGYPPGYGPPPGYEQPAGYGQAGYPQPTYPTYPTYPGYTVYPYPPPYPVPPPGDGPRNQAIAALVANVVAAVLCCPLVGIAGIVLSAVAMSRSDRDPDSARRLVKWSWGVLAATIVLGIVAIVLIVVFSEAEG